MLNLGVKKQRKGQKPFSVLRQVAKVQFIKEDPGVTVKGASVESGKLGAVLDVHFADLIRKENALLKRYEAAWFIRVRGTKSVCRWSVLV